MTTIIVSVILHCNLEWMTILRLMLPTPIADHRRSRDKAHDKEDGSQLLEVRKLEGKLDAIVNLQSGVDEHLEAFALRIRSRPLSQESAASIFPMTTILVSVLLRSNLQWIRILRLMLQTPIADHHSSREKALDREDGSQLLRIRSLPLLQESAASVLEMTTILVSVLHCRNLEGVHDVATDTSTETRKLEGELDALVNLVTQLAANQKPASIARVYGIRSSNDHHTSFSATNDPIFIRGVDVMDTNTSAETRKLEGKLDALMNLVTQLAANQKSASVARICCIRSSNDNHTSDYPSSQQSGVDEHPEAYAAKTYSRPQ
ncbi:hypothetical protein Fmac_032872 [Flemingia macrophylla]|uniref:Uncharacterized protein n=1 Tax=Flemingia macrophylla TaxID=520843 RepID=A0ABD1L661_9FABA